MMIKKTLDAFTYLSNQRPIMRHQRFLRLSAFQQKFIFLVFLSFPMIAQAEHPVPLASETEEVATDNCSRSFPGYSLSSQNFLDVKASDSFQKQAKILINMNAHEQTVRNHFQKGQSINWKEVEEIDRRNTRDFKKIIEKEGLLSISQIGGLGVEAEFSLIQRSRDLYLQKNALEMMRRLFARGDFPGDYVAILEDQLLIKDGKPQIYGTKIRQDGSPYPISDKDQLDARRASHGLPPFRKAVCPLPEKGA